MFSVQCCSEAPGNFPTKLSLEHVLGRWGIPTNPSLSRKGKCKAAYLTVQLLCCSGSSFSIETAPVHLQGQFLVLLAQATAPSVTSLVPSIQEFCCTHHLLTGQQWVATLLMVTLIKHRDSPWDKQVTPIPVSCPYVVEVPDWLADETRSQREVTQPMERSAPHGDQHMP